MLVPLVNDIFIIKVLDWILNTLRFDKKTGISWSIGKTFVEENANQHLPLGDYLTMLGGEYAFVFFFCLSTIYLKSF
jgi:hypothetical protein